MPKTPAQLDREIAAELERTAADYVGKAKARAMGRSGYFRDQAKRNRITSAAREPAPVPDRIEYVAQSIGGSVLARAWTIEAAIARANEVTAPDYVVQIWRVQGDKRKRVAERIRWNAATKSRIWERT